MKKPNRFQMVVASVLVLIVLMILVIIRMTVPKTSVTIAPAETITVIQEKQSAIIVQNFQPSEEEESTAQANHYRVTKRMELAHQMAESARNLGLPESSDVIKQAKEIWEQELFNLNILAKTIQVEARDCPLEHQLAVGGVVKNRVESSKFPNTYYDVVTQPYQYNPDYAKDFDGVEDQYYQSAKAILDGEYSIPSNVLYQGNHKQGTGIWWTSHIKTPYWESTTYFCYG